MSVEPGRDGLLAPAVLADAVLMLHVAVVLLVVLGLAVIVVGGWRGWDWSRSPWFRGLHLLAIGVVVLQAWLGRRCPLTDLEMHYRQLAGQHSYGESFLAHWLGQWLYWDFPMWVFALIYSGFAAMVVLAWWKWPPRRKRRGE